MMREGIYRSRLVELKRPDLSCSQTHLGIEAEYCRQLALAENAVFHWVEEEFAVVCQHHQHWDCLGGDGGAKHVSHRDVDALGAHVAVGSHAFKGRVGEWRRDQS